MQKIVYGCCIPWWRSSNLAKTLLVMKLTIVFLTAAFLNVYAGGHSQTITLSGKNVELKKVFTAIKKQTGYVVFYNRSDLNGTSPVTLSVHDMPLRNFLDVMLKDQPLAYKIEDKTIMLYRRRILREAPYNEPVMEEVDRIIKGKVTDSKGEPLQNVSVIVVSAQGGTTTNNEGQFSITTSDNSNIILEFSSVGYQTRRMSVGNQTEVNVVLELEVAGLSDVVVVGYGTQKKSDLTGAVTNINERNFNKGVIVNPIQQIQGKVSGLVITQPSGDPNQNLSIRLRGQASLSGGQAPLIVLDGVTLDDPTIISSIPADQIASYDILKDASASAIYGSRAANGVIIVNTKAGVPGKTLISYSGKVGVAKLANMYDFLNANEWKEASKSIGTSDQTINAYDHGANTNWLRTITHAALINNHNISLSGGSKDFTFYGSANYLNREGIVMNTGREEIALNFNAVKKAFKNKLEWKVGVLNTIVNKKLVDASIFTYVYNSLPVYPAYNTDGSYFIFVDKDVANPLLHQNEQVNSGKDRLSILNSRLDFTFLKGLSAGVNGSLTYFNEQSNFFRPTFPIEDNINLASKANSDRNSQKGDIHVNYNRYFGNSHIDVTGVHEYSRFNFENFSANGQGYLIGQNTNNALQNGNSIYNKISSYKEEFELSSFIARISYDYSNKYYATMSYRRDGSSKLNSINRWGNFPAFSLAWRISRENLLRDVSWINDLKIRGGIGVTGNQDAISPYSTLRLLGGLGRFYDAASNSYPLAYGPVQNDNPVLKWEEIQGVNLGLDFAMLRNWVEGSINWFHNTTKNLLFDYSVPVPPFFVNTILANVGQMTNKGFEIEASARIIDRRKLSWSVNTQFTFIKTRINSLSGHYAEFELSTDDIGVGHAIGRGVSTDPITYLKVGYSPYVFYLPHYVGINDNGEQLFSDGKGGEVTQLDLNRDSFVYADPNPRFSFGFGSDLKYRKWSLNFFLRGVSGQRIFNNTRLILDNIVRLPGNNITLKGFNSGIKDAQVASDYWLKNASFLRMDNITLAYHFKKNKIFKDWGVFLAANNLFVITPYDGLDPEIRTADSDQAFIDSNYMSDGYYPRDRFYSIGFSLSLE